jgi:hypothetical protein
MAGEIVKNKIIKGIGDYDKPLLDVFVQLFYVFKGYLYIFFNCYATKILCYKRN